MIEDLSDTGLSWLEEMTHSTDDNDIYPVNRSMIFMLEDDTIGGIFDKLLSTKPGPKNFREALESPDKEKWMEALTSELKSHYDLNTIEWFVVDKHDHRFHELPGRVAFNVKYNDLGQVDKLKCRMLVNGMRAIPNLLFDKKFAQAPTLASIPCIRPGLP